MEPNPSGVRGPSPKPSGRGRARGQLPRPAPSVVVPSPQAIPAAEIGRLAVSDVPVTPPPQPRLASGECSGASQQLEESSAGFPLEAVTQVESLSTVGLVPLVKLAQRPDVGSVGREIRLRANFFEVDCENARPVYYYRVYIDFASKLNVTDNKLPRKEPGRRDMFTAEDNRLIFWDIIRTNTGNANPNDNIFLHSRGIAYDGANTVLMTHKPLFERGNLSHGVGVFDHEFTLPGLGVARRFRALWYPRDLESYRIRAGEEFRGQDPAFYFSPNHIIDIFFRQYPSYPSANSRFAPTKRSFFLRPAPAPAAAPIDLTAGKEIWHGYSAATHILSGNKFWMNFDTSNTAFFKSQMLLVSIEELLSAKYGRRSTVSFTPRNTDIAQFLSQVPGATRYLDSELKGVKLKCTHIPPFAAASAASRVYKYKRMHNKNADQEFIAGNEEQQQQQSKSITRYFLEKYNFTLRFPHYPLIAVVGRRDENIFLPLEVCRVKECQPSTRKLNEDQTANMIRAVCWDADERRRRIEGMLADVQEPVSEGRYMAELGLSLRPEMAEVNGRVLPAPDIRYANDARPQLRGSWQGEWNHPQPQHGRGVLIKPASFTCSIVCFGVGSDQEPHIENFWRMLRDRAGQFGCRLPAAPVCVNYVSEQHMSRLQDGLNNHKQKMSAEATDHFDNNMITLCIMDSKSFYQEIKYTAEIQVGLMTQCILSKNVIPPRGPGNRKPVPSPQTIDNLLLKINMKMAGENWRVLENLKNLLPGHLPPALPATSNEQDPPRFLVLGIDVTHPPPGDRRSPSIAAVCCSLDPYFVRYTAIVRMQKERREHLVDLKQIVKDLYDLYMRRNAGAKPRHVVVYRDGVSDGQFQAVLQEELGSIKEGIASFYGFYADTFNPRPTVTYIVVQKRHHARLFCQDERDKIGRAKNIPPGTCVDQDIVHPDGFDFYLCSHFGIQGTSKPAHYHVLHDNAGFHADQLQLLTFRLCNVYERCARSVSIPAPVYYADLICRRARTWLDKSFSQLDDSASEGSGGSAANQPGEDDMRAALNLEHSLQEQMYFI